MDIGQPKIIFFDIETMPNLREALKFFPKLDDWPGNSMKAHVNSVLCIGWKELGKKKVNVIKAWDGPNWGKDVNDDKYVVDEFRKVIESADAICTHNGTSFDVPFVQTRLLVHNLPPIDPKIKHIDTRHLGKKIRGISNKLDDLAQLLGLGRKMDHEGWDLWVKCWDRDQKSLDKMAKYCAQDVRVLEELYLKLRRFAGNKIPNHNIWSLEKMRCPTCGSLNVQKNGSRSNQTMVYHRIICNVCGTHGQIKIKDKHIKP